MSHDIALLRTPFLAKRWAHDATPRSALVYSYIHTNRNRPTGAASSKATVLLVFSCKHSGKELLKNTAQHSSMVRRLHAPWPSGEIGLGGGASASASASAAVPNPSPPSRSPLPAPQLESPCSCPGVAMTLPLAASPESACSSREASAEVASTAVGATGPLLCICPVETKPCHGREGSGGMGWHECWSCACGRCAAASVAFACLPKESAATGRYLCWYATTTAQQLLRRT